MNNEYKMPEYCSQCPNHCPADDLHCGRGRAYFANLEGGAEAEQSGHRPDHGFHERGGRHEGHGPHEGQGPREGHGPHQEHMHHPRPEINEQSSLETLLRACGHRLHHGMPGGPHGSQEQVLKMLADRKEPVDQRELQDMMRVRPASASELLAKLEEKGWISRERDAEDRRRARVTLTEAGMLEAGKAPEAPQEDLFAGLTPEEQETLRGLLLKLLESWK